MSSLMPSWTYNIIRIPTDSPRFNELVTKFRETKLAALKAEPDGFAVKHTDEVLHPLSTWQQRLQPPSTIMICVALLSSAASTTDEDALISGQWVGMATIRGPLPYSTFYLPESGQPVPEDPTLETRWHFNNLYVSYPHRGKGLARNLIEASIAVACEQTRGLNSGDRVKARIRLFCDPAKTSLVPMYEGMGCQKAGKCTLKEAFEANGDGGLIPVDTASTQDLRDKWERRYGLAMERVVDA